MEFSAIEILGVFCCGVAFGFCLGLSTRDGGRP